MFLNQSYLTFLKIDVHKSKWYIRTKHEDWGGDEDGVGGGEPEQQACDWARHGWPAIILYSSS